MQEAFVNINNIPTKVVTVGRWITEKPEKDEDKIILIIPGNPGVTGFYKKFMQILYEKHQCPVWIISHTGHDRNRQKAIEGLFPRPLGLEEQVKQKITFIEEYVPQNANLHIIAHSIGGYMTLELLKEPKIEKRIAQTYLLFPTIEDMIGTTNGKFLYNYIRHIVSVVVFLAWFFTILPKIVSVNLLKFYMFLVNMPANTRDPVMTLIHPKILEQVFYLAYRELEQVNERDNENIKKICTGSIFCMEKMMVGIIRIVAIILRKIFHKSMQRCQSMNILLFFMKMKK
ncbi:hypothetical protein HHI36_014023 [Cryptolaemus montrouzieri]|uniref:Lipid droplet-associated hydrolase n=1 Tax=Cryptolaemus montrouzieri TaxID=559131 RepID=A0ABD2N1L0_9CUCU